MKSIGLKSVCSLTAGLLLFGGGSALAKKERIRHELTAVSDTSVRGMARLVLTTADSGRFEIRGRGLQGNASYDVLVGSVKVGTLATKSGGYGRARFRTRPRGHDFLLGFDPRGQIVTVRSAAGEDVLVGTVPAGTMPPADEVICCVPDDDHSECEDRTADECASQGGTVSSATSCLPNPCAAAPVLNEDVVCCLPDDSGPECEDRTVAECAARGGVAVEATSCDPNPCAGTPAVDDDIVCCLPDDSGPECEDRTPAQCLAQGGIDMGPGSCTPNPCAGAAADPSPTPVDDHGGNSGSGQGGSKSGGSKGGGDDGGGRDNAGGRPVYY